jgi:hypothetical protein
MPFHDEASLAEQGDLAAFGVFEEAMLPAKRRVIPALHPSIRAKQ